MGVCNIRAYFNCFISIAIIKECCLFQLFISCIDKLIYTFSRTDKVNSFDNCCHNLQLPPPSSSSANAAMLPFSCHFLHHTAREEGAWHSGRLHFALPHTPMWSRQMVSMRWPWLMTTTTSAPWTLHSPSPCFHSPLSPVRPPTVQSFPPSLPHWTAKCYFIFDRNKLK